ncbi:S-adenosylmethionine synthase [Candidatus Hepatincolaceae symbiont of Richtersius coronifer]
MLRKDFLFTSESVSEGHPDKIADQISDSILDYFLSQDPEARVAIETLVTTNQVVLAGEVKTNIRFTLEDLNKVARETIKDIGYTQKGFDYRSLKIDNYIHGQSEDIAVGVDATANKEEGAGDQGLMFGYACKETSTFMPATLHYAHKILYELSLRRKAKQIKGLLPDAKSQVTLEYENYKPKRVHTIVVSHQHEENMNQEQVRDAILPVLAEVFPNILYNPEKIIINPKDREIILSDSHIVYINPTGRFVVGGPDGDTGLTGRKIIVDSYGGVAPHGGGAFSGKDPTKVDRSGAYVARYLAKNIVAAGLADKCTIQLSYAIGVAKPLSLYVNCHNSSNINEVEIEQLIQQLVDLSPKGIRTHLKLNAPIYRPTATYGHFGIEPYQNFFPWEKLDLVDSLKKHFKL